MAVGFPSFDQCFWLCSVSKHVGVLKDLEDGSVKNLGCGVVSMQNRMHAMNVNKFLDNYMAPIRRDIGSNRFNYSILMVYKCIVSNLIFGNGVTVCYCLNNYGILKNTNNCESFFTHNFYCDAYNTVVHQRIYPFINDYIVYPFSQLHVIHLLSTRKTMNEKSDKSISNRKVKKSVESTMSYVLDSYKTEIENIMYKMSSILVILLNCQNDKSKISKIENMSFEEFSLMVENNTKQGRKLFEFMKQDIENINGNMVIKYLKQFGSRIVCFDGRQFTKTSSLVDKLQDFVKIQEKKKTIAKSHHKNNETSLQNLENVMITKIPKLQDNDKVCVICHTHFSQIVKSDEKRIVTRRESKNIKKSRISCRYCERNFDAINCQMFKCESCDSGNENLCQICLTNNDTILLKTRMEIDNEIIDCINKVKLNVLMDDEKLNESSHIRGKWYNNNNNNNNNNSDENCYNSDYLSESEEYYDIDTFWNTNINTKTRTKTKRGKERNKKKSENSENKEKLWNKDSSKQNRNKFVSSGDRNTGSNNDDNGQNDGNKSSNNKSGSWAARNKNNDENVENMASNEKRGEWYNNNGDKNGKYGKNSESDIDYLNESRNEKGDNSEINTNTKTKKEKETNKKRSENSGNEIDNEIIDCRNKVKCDESGRLFTNEDNSNSNERSNLSPNMIDWIYCGESRDNDTSNEAKLWNQDDSKKSRNKIVDSGDLSENKNGLWRARMKRMKRLERMKRMKIVKQERETRRKENEANNNNKMEIGTNSDRTNSDDIDINTRMKRMERMVQEREEKRNEKIFENSGKNRLDMSNASGKTKHSEFVNENEIDNDEPSYKRRRISMGQSNSKTGANNGNNYNGNNMVDILTDRISNQIQSIIENVVNCTKTINVNNNYTYKFALWNIENSNRNSFNHSYNNTNNTTSIGSHNNTNNATWHNDLVWANNRNNI